MKRRTKKALSCLLFDEDFLTTIKNVPIATFRASTTKIKKLVVGIEPVQAGSGDPSPDNVRPISGFTGLNVYGTGKNLLDWNDFSDYSSWSNVAPYGSYTTSAGTLGYILPTVAGKEYTLSFGLSADNVPTYLYLCRANGTDTTQLVQRFTAGSSDPIYATEKTFTVETGWMYYIRLYTNNATFFAGQIAKISNAQLELGSTATSYSAFSGTTLPVSWQSEAGTVYAGYLSIDKDGNVTLTGTMAYYTISANSSFGLDEQATNTTRVGFALPSGKLVGVSERDKFICNMGAYSSRTIGSNAQVGDCSLYATGGVCYFLYHTDKTATISEARQALIDAGCSVCYYLATPVTYTLAPVTLPSLIINQINNIWADTGNIIELVV